MRFSECLAKLNRSIQDIVPDDSAMAAWASNYAGFHRHRLAHDFEMVAERAELGARILEYGALPLFLTVALKDAGYSVVGLDIDPGRFGRVAAEHNLDIVSIDFEREPLPFPDESFDIILFNEVFEHLRIDPIFTLGEARRVLKTGGTMLLSTPNVRSLRGLWALLANHTSAFSHPDLYESYAMLHTRGHMGHVREYTAREVARFLERLGFRVQETVFRHSDPPQPGHRKAAILYAAERAFCLLCPQFKPMCSLICGRLRRPRLLKPRAPWTAPPPRLPLQHRER